MAKKKPNIKPCVIDGTPTPYVMNINFKAVHICDSCANSIMLQQASWLIEQQKELPKSKA